MYFLFNLFAYFCNFLELFELNSYINNIHSSFNFLTDSNIAFYKSFWNDSLGYWYVIFYIYFIVSYLETELFLYNMESLVVWISKQQMTCDGQNNSTHKVGTIILIGIKVGIRTVSFTRNQVFLVLKKMDRLIAHTYKIMPQSKEH